MTNRPATLRGLLLFPLLFALAAAARGQATAYTDEGAFLAALAAQGVSTVTEGFEDDAVWGGVRTTIVGGPMTARSIQNLGLTWTSSSLNNGITTGSGPALTGQWGFFSLPHGDYANGITDGFGAVGDTPLVAIGGWIETNTPRAKIGLTLDGAPVDFGGGDALGTQSAFFGAIDPGGFAGFEFLEQEGTIGDQKFVFADDFTFAFGGSIVDCNGNGVPDPLDIAGGTSGDCDFDGVPDECQIAAGSTAPGGPFFCTTGCDPDCNANGVLDACEVASPVLYSSGPLSPIGFGSPQAFVIASPQPSQANVILDFTTYANLGGSQDEIRVDVNGVPIGAVFTTTGSDCPEGLPDTARLIVALDVFNAAVGGGDATIGLTASSEVDPTGCEGPTWIAVEATLFVPSGLDANANGVPDECEERLYCTAKTNSLGCLPQVAIAGTPGATAAGSYDFSASNVLNGKNGLPFYGVGGPAALPFLGGTLCVQPPLRRLAVQSSGGSSPPVQDCSGSFLTDFNALIQSGSEPLLVPGQRVNAQWWSRDPAHLDGTGVGLTDALEFVIGL